MKVPCTVSHEEPLGDGRFKIYEAGKSYEVENPDPKYFDVPEEAQAKPAVETEKIEDPPIRKNKIEDSPRRKGGYER